MSLGMFVEGESDRTAIPILLEKIGRKPQFCRRLKQGDMANAEILGRHVKVVLSQNRGTDLVLIFLDSECTDPEETKKRVESCERELNRVKLGAAIRYIVVDHSLEGWLCCDEVALRKVIGQKATINIKSNPEDDCRPAQLLGGIFKSNGKDFFKTRDNSRIAAAIENPRNIAKKSPTFKYLLNILSL